MARTKLALRQQPDTKLSSAQFEQLTVGGDITINSTWLTNEVIEIGNAQGWGSLPPLTAPVLSFGPSTSTQNVINWTAPANATGYVLQVLIDVTWTTIYTGPLLTYTHTGLTASTNYEYRVKATAPGYADSPWATGSQETGAGGGYVIERAISLDLQGEFGNTIEGDTVTWNTWKATNAALGVDGGAVISNLVTESNVATAIGAVNVGAWNGASAGTGGATGPRPYPLAAINGGFTLSSDVGLKITGANQAKFYQVYVLAADSEANAAVDITAGGSTINVITTNNYPVDGSDRYTNAAVAKFYNIVPNGAGEFTISFHKTGSYYQVSASLILIQESNIAKP